MTFIREVKRKNKDGTVKTYYAEVESVREGKKVHQKYIRSLGSDPTKPSNYLLEPVHFSYLALRLMQGNLSPNDVFEMLDGMGTPVTRNELNIQKTEIRKIRTLFGEIHFKFCYKFCKTHGPSNQKLHSIIIAICPHDRTFDTKVMIAVGLFRWFLNMQREEIQLLFFGRGIEISTGEIYNLSEEFLLRFYALHN